MITAHPSRRPSLPPALCELSAAKPQGASCPLARDVRSNLASFPAPFILKTGPTLSNKPNQMLPAEPQGWSKRGQATQQGYFRVSWSSAPHLGETIACIRCAYLVRHLDAQTLNFDALFVKHAFHRQFSRCMHDMQVRRWAVLSCNKKQLTDVPGYIVSRT